MVIASTDTFDADKRPCFVEPSTYIGTDGAQVIRLPYRQLIPRVLAAKIRAYLGVQSILKRLSPDIILFHGLCAWELLNVAKYVDENRNVLLYADCHEDFNNSARSFFSKWGLHYSFYRPIVRHCLAKMRKILCVSQESIYFAQHMYGIPSRLLEFFPLGGVIFDDATYAATRKSTRAERGWPETEIIFMQCGKIDTAKKLASSLRAFMTVPGSHLRFAIVGQIMSDVENEVRPLISADFRIQELGWVDSRQLQALLCAADVYVQPGSQSATMQMSLCCRCAVVLANVLSHHVFVEANGILVDDDKGLALALLTLGQETPTRLHQMSARSASIANKLLDYRHLANRVLS